MRRTPETIHSAFVWFSKWVACAASLIIIVYLGVIISLPQIDNTGVLSIVSNTANASTPGMINPRYRILGEGDDFYTLTAGEANEAQPETVDMQDVQADVHFKDDGWTLVQAKHGIFEKDLNYLHLNRDVLLYHESGHELQTDSVDIDFQQKRITGTFPVSGHGPLGTLRGQGLDLAKDKGNIIITGRSRLTFTMDH